MGRRPTVRKADCGGTGWNAEAGGLVSLQPSAGFGSATPATSPLSLVGLVFKPGTEGPVLTSLD